MKFLKKAIDAIKALLKEKESWGYHLMIDLEGCDPTIIRDEKLVVTYIEELVKLIDMTPYGEPMVIHFGKDPKVSGFSFHQFIEESNITGHLINKTNEAKIDIFSCKKFDVNLAGNASLNFFAAKKAKMTFLKR